jgi:hypothetical protein
MKPLIFFLIFTTSCFGQNSPKEMLLDSLNKSREIDRGAFNLYIKKPEFEIIAGNYRNRETSQQGFEPFTLTYHIYLPFQFDLNYVNQTAKDKLLKIECTSSGTKCSNDNKFYVFSQRKGSIHFLFTSL